MLQKSKADKLIDIDLEYGQCYFRVAETQAMGGLLQSESQVHLSTPRSHRNTSMTLWTVAAAKYALAAWDEEVDPQVSFQFTNTALLIFSSQALNDFIFFRNDERQTFFFT